MKLRELCLRSTRLPKTKGLTPGGAAETRRRTAAFAKCPRQEEQAQTPHVGADYSRQIGGLTIFAFVAIEIGRSSELSMVMRGRD